MDCEACSECLACDGQRDVIMISNKRTFRNKITSSPSRGCLRDAHSIAYSDRPLRILWVGRMLDWKRVETLVAAVKTCITLYNMNVPLDIYGHGPMEARLKELAEGYEGIRFHDYVPVTEVRALMRAHDIYVLPSDGGEGWGAVVSEALEEGLCVFGSYEAGASATMLDKKHLFAAQDVDGLVYLLRYHATKHGDIGPWTAEGAAEALLRLTQQ